MKKITLAALFLCAIPVSALWEGASSAKVGTADTGMAFLLHQPAVSFDDLDVRDAQNRPVRRPEAKAELENLFRNNLLNLLVSAMPHVAAQTLSYVEFISSLFNKHFFKRALAALAAYYDAIMPSQRRFVHNVHILWITLFSCTAFSAVLFMAACRPSFSNRLVLRC